MKMSGLKIFYFSGTGNARQVALWFSEIAANRGIDVQTFNIGKIDRDKIEISPDETIIIISSIHGFSYPHITVKFIEHFPKGNNRVVLMNTRGGLKIGKRITWGLSGSAFLLSLLVLRKKGYKITGQIPFDMPLNWLSIHPALKGKTVKFIHEKNYEKVKKHADIIFSGQSDFPARRDLIQDIFILPISVLYYFAGRFFLAKSFYAAKTCDNCGICEKECPVRAIKNSSSLPFWTLKCESCMQCMNICPKRAIEAAHGLWIILFVLASILSGLFCRLLNISHIGLIALLWNVIFFISLIILYRVQYLLLKNKIIGKLISFTSLTHYKFWGRYFSKFNEKSQ